MSRHAPWRTLLVLALLAAAASAHGGQYRGPGSQPPGPLTGGPNTGARHDVQTGVSWQLWWEHNKDDLLLPDEPSRPGLVTGSDEFYLGPRRSVVADDAMLPTESDRRDLIAKALRDALGSAADRDMATACMVGLAKVGFDPAPDTLAALFAARLGEPNQEVRETAALSMGIAGLPAALPQLAALLADDAEGQRLAGGKESVPDRTRTFAAWSIGLLAGRSTDAGVKAKALGLLLEHLGAKGEPSRDLRVGLVQAVGLLDLRPERSAKERLLLYRAVDGLWGFYGKDLGKGAQWVQAHVPAAIARLIGRGCEPMHQRAKELLAAELSRDGRINQIRQSAALALGALCVPAEQFAEDAAFSAALLDYYKNGVDQQARFFAVAALGRIGGAANRGALMQCYPRANQATAKPWIAVALGLIARSALRRDQGALDGELGRMLLDDFPEVDADTTKGALALALGLCRHQPALALLQRELAARPRHDGYAGYLALGISLFGERAAATELRELMQQSLRRPFVLQQCALGLGCLRDPTAVPTLLEMLGKSESTATLAAIATALSELRDRRSIAPLLAAMQDHERPSLARAFAAAALGGIGDKEALRWNAAIARDVNYAALVDTLGNGSSGVLDIL